MIRLEQDGVRWELQPDFAPLLRDVLAAPNQVIKESTAKLVTVHSLSGRTFYVKRYRNFAVPFRPLKYFFKRSQARHEWEAAQQLEALSVPIVRHLALGERWSLKGLAETVLITEGFAGTTLDSSPCVNYTALLEFVNHLHERGVVQRDLHPGNILVSPETGELRLVDLHGAEIKCSLTPAERAANLAYLRIFVPLPVSPELEQLSASLRRRIFAGRSRRCLRHNREFASKIFGALRWQVRLPFLNSAAEKILEDPDEFLLRRAELLKTGRSSTVGRADGLVLKRYNFRKLGSLVKDLFRPSRARRAYRKAYHLELVGIPTARPIATADRRVLRFLQRSFLLMEEIPGAVELRKWRGDKRHAVRSAAELIARLHNEGFMHRDLKETNIVFDSENRIFLLDLEGLEFVETVSRRRAAADLARLARASQNLPQFSGTDRANFLRRYCRARRMRPRQLRS